MKFLFRHMKQLKKKPNPKLINLDDDTLGAIIAEANVQDRAVKNMIEQILINWAKEKK